MPWALKIFLITPESEYQQAVVVYITQSPNLKTSLKLISPVSPNKSAGSLKIDKAGLACWRGRLQMCVIARCLLCRPEPPAHHFWSFLMFEDRSLHTRRTTHLERALFSEMCGSPPPRRLSERLCYGFHAWLYFWCIMYEHVRTSSVLTKFTETCTKMAMVKRDA